MRRVIELNNNWYFNSNYSEGMELNNEVQDYEKVNLPHNAAEVPYNYFDENIYQKKTIYKYKIKTEEAFKGKSIYINFQGVMSYARVFLNGIFLGEHKGGYTPFDIRIDSCLDYTGKCNILSVVADSSEINTIPPFGGQIDYLTYSGIYREVSMSIYDDLFIERVKIETPDVLEEKKTVKVFAFINNLKNRKGYAEFKIDLLSCDGKGIATKLINKEIKSSEEEFTFRIDDLKDIKLWDIDNPELYEIRLSFLFNDIEDEYKNKFGFREAVFTPHGFYLNGKKLKIRGLNRHQSYPYVGYAMPKRVQEKDALILKNELHVNLVRTSHYPQSIHFLNKCDEIGLLVFEEIPGWQHIGNKEWKETAKENVKEMIRRDWNHPSIVLWGVRINESNDDDDFYSETNQIAHSLDKERQTGGVRCITNSNLLEDVYTYNDFIHNGTEVPLRDQKVVTGLDHYVPFIVTEYNGHMYPTKRFDQEERQMEHCLRHLRVQNASYMDDTISGAIGWCAFDYNTHKDFGSGDRICYHGVMDMFRIPKFASYVYSSQVSPDMEKIMEPVTFWARGERDECRVLPVLILTNCDYITFRYGDNKEKKIYPDRKSFEGLPYPPIIIDDKEISEEEAGSWGMKWEDAVITGFYKGEKVVEKKLCKNPSASKLYIEADDLELSAKSKDATRIVVKMLDQYGNILPFADNVIKINIEGPAKLQGPSETALKGGVIAFWIETINQPGEVTIKVDDASQIKINVK